MKKEPQPGWGPETVTTDGGANILTGHETAALPRSRGRCEACGDLIGKGTDWRQAIYHHVRLVSDVNVSDKEVRSAANCMVLHRDCHDDPVSFYNLHGFYPDNLIRK